MKKQSDRFPTPDFRLKFPSSPPNYTREVVYVAVVAITTMVVLFAALWFWLWDL